MRDNNNQIGGDHYLKCGIMPTTYIRANNLDFFEGNIVKYITRHKDKGGAEDIEKVIHYAEMILEDVYGYKNGKPIVGLRLDTGEPVCESEMEDAWIKVKEDPSSLVVDEERHWVMMPKSELKQKGLTDREAEKIINK